MGAVTPLGLDVASSWKRLENGGSGIVPTSESPLSQYDDYEKIGAKVVGAVPDFMLPAQFKEKSIKVDQNYMHRSALLGTRAVYEALSQAGLLNEDLVIDPDKVDPYTIGLYMGTTFAGMAHSVQAMLKDRLSPSDLFKTLPARVATSQAMQFGAKNLSPMIGWECASGAVATDIGARSLLRYRDDMPPVANVVVAGGTDGPLEPANLAYFEALKTAVSPSTDPITASRPFDKAANGLVMGEGAAALVLETLAHAKWRGINESDIQAELVGYASLTDAQSKTRAGIEGAAHAMAQVAYMGRLTVGETIYINAHATSTSDGDPIEANIIQQFVTEAGQNRNNTYVTSTKGATGHTMGAAGAIEAVFSIKALQTSTIPPALNLENPIEETQGLELSPGRTTPLASLDMAISNSLGFGGGVTTLAFRKFQP